MSERKRSSREKKESKKSRKRDRAKDDHHDDDDDDYYLSSEEERLLRKARDFVERHEGGRGDVVPRKKSSYNNDDDSHYYDRRERARHSKRGYGDDDDDAGGGRSSRSRKRRSSRKHDKRSSSERDNDTEHHRHHVKKKHRRKERNDRDDDDSDNDDGRESDERNGRKQHRRKRHSRRHREQKANERQQQQQQQQQRHVRKEDLFPLGPIVSVPPVSKLDTVSDYFEYHQHLRLFLYREEGLYFEDLSSEEAREAFGRFVKIYNAGSLNQAYYDPKGLPAEALEECKRTRHKWAFQTSATEREKLEIVSAGVRKQTEYNAATKESSTAVGDRPDHQYPQALGTNSRPHHQRQIIDSPTIRDDKKAPPTAEERAAARTANRRLKEHIRTVGEEITGGKKYGRERQLEKRKERAAAIHGSAREREETAGSGIVLDDSAVYGGEDSGFQEALARERIRAARREEQRNSRVTELQQKEKEKQENMLKVLGLSGITAGQKITIAPRKDG